MQFTSRKEDILMKLLFVVVSLCIASPAFAVWPTSARDKAVGRCVSLYSKKRLPANVTQSVCEVCACAVSRLEKIYPTPSPDEKFMHQLPHVFRACGGMDSVIGTPSSK